MLCWFGIGNYPVGNLQPMSKTDFEVKIRGHLNITQWTNYARRALNRPLAEINASFGTRAEIVSELFQRCPFQ